MSVLTTYLTPDVQAAVIATPIRDLTSVLLAALVGIGLIARAPAARWTALIVALLVAPLLLAGAVLEDDRVNALLDRPVLLLAGAVVALVGLVIAVAVLVRWPSVLPVAVAIAIPLRLPIAVGGESVNLLLPLYGLIGAGVVAFAVRARRRGKQIERSWDLRHGPTAGEELAQAWTTRSLSGAAAAVPVLLAATVAVYALRIPFSIDADRGVQTLCFFLVPFAALYVVLREIQWDAAQLRRTAAALVVLALVAVALGDYEYFTGQVLWQQNVLDESSLNATIRVNSLFFDPNIYGRFLMVILIGVLGALAWGARGVRAAGLAVLFALVWAGLFVTYSQSSMLGLLVGAIVLLGLRFGARRAALVGGTLLVAGVVAVVALGGFLRIDTSSSEGLDNSSAGRWALVQGGAELFAAKPVLGWGSGGYRAAYRRQTQVDSYNTVAASHTIPLTVAAEQGAIGLVIYIGLIVSALIALLRRAWTSVGRAVIGAAFLGLVIHSWLYAAFLEDPLTWALLAVGLSLGAEREDASPGAGTVGGQGSAADGSDDPAGSAAAPAMAPVAAGTAAAPAGRAGSVPAAAPSTATAAKGASPRAKSAGPATTTQVIVTPTGHRPTPHDVVGPVTLVGPGEGEGPGALVGDSGRPAAGDGPSPHDVVGPVTAVEPGEGAGPGVSIGDSGRPTEDAGPTPQDVVGPVTAVEPGEGAGPGVSIGESGRPPGEPDGGHGRTAPRPGPDA